MCSRSLLGFVFMAGLLFSTPTNADGPAVCGDFSALAGMLKQGRLAPAFVAISDDGALITVYRDPGDSWVLLITTFWGESCVITTGHSWQEMMTPGRSTSEKPS